MIEVTSNLSAKELATAQATEGDIKTELLFLILEELRKLNAKP